MYFNHWKALLALRTNRGCVNFEKSASRSFIKLLWFKQGIEFFMFVPNQVSQTLSSRDDREYYSYFTLTV